MFIIKFTDPKGEESYWPKGFGFSSHKHATDIADAEIFDNESKATGHLYSYINPPAFWESERLHKAAMQKRFRAWRYEVIPFERGCRP